jgi:hypothetical protein
MSGRGGDRRSGMCGDLTRQIIALAAQPEGVTNRDVRALTGQNVGWVSACMASRVESGYLFRSKAPQQRLRWFDTAERAKAWERQPAPVCQPIQELSMSNVTTAIHELAAGPDGTTNAEVRAALGVRPNSASTRLSQLHQRGLLFRARVPHKHMRFFTEHAAAVAWAERVGAVVLDPATHCPPPRVARSTRALGKLANAMANKMRAKSAKATAAPVTIRAGAPAQVVIPAHVKVQHIPSPPVHGPGARVYVPADTVVVGGFRTLGVGRYL